MTERESHIASLISSRIKYQDPRADVILFGSHARGDAHDESDWDVLILIDRPKKSRSVEEMYRQVIFQLELELGEPISTLIYSKRDWETKHICTPFYQIIKREGISIT
ncbi:MAG: nucleotidyltransferase domain-containing protein [Bacteroidales bacterium]|nr:nucleotidyltransferase domain-containing protein [Bacteroidales bacterium]